MNIARIIYGPSAVADYATSSNVESVLTWSSLGSLLTNYTARAIYALPIAGYLILYSDYFQSLFRFTVLSPSRGFLSFIVRINLIYHGSLFLLAAYVLFLLFSPRLLQYKKDRQHFVSDIIVSRDRSVVAQIASLVRQQLTPLPAAQSEPLKDLLRLTTIRANSLGANAGEYEDDIPRVLILYFNWQNFRRPKLRVLIFCLTSVGYLMLILPAFDLFLQVISTDVRNWFG